MLFNSPNNQGMYYNYSHLIDFKEVTEDCTG